jgi:hypothetical protein
MINMTNMTKTIGTAMQCWQNLQTEQRLAVKWLFSMLDLGVTKEVATIVATAKLEIAGYEYKHALKTAQDMAELV